MYLYSLNKPSNSGTIVLISVFLSLSTAFVYHLNCFIASVFTGFVSKLSLILSNPGFPCFKFALLNGTLLSINFCTAICLISSGKILKSKYSGFTTIFLKYISLPGVLIFWYQFHTSPKFKML